MTNLTGVLILAAAVAVLVAVGVLLWTRKGPGGGTRSLRHRFGPEYDRTLDRHGGDDEAAHRDLTERLQRYGDIRPVPLEPEIRERYAERWTALQERFVDTPKQAVAEADDLLARLTESRGFPAPDRPDEQLAALSVHHPHHVEGLRTLRGAVSSGTASTEELRTALVEARDLFEELTVDKGRSGAESARTRPVSRRDHGSLLHLKGSGT